MVSRWLWPGNRTFLEAANMAVTWWIVAFLATLTSYEQYMRTLWPKSMKIWWSNHAFCSLIHTSFLRDLSLKPWGNQHMLTFKVNVKVKLESKTFTKYGAYDDLVLYLTKVWGRYGCTRTHIDTKKNLLKNHFKREVKLLFTACL